MKYTQSERQQYNDYRNRVCESLNITKNDYNYLRIQGEYLHRIYENNCNGLYNTEEDYFSAIKTYEKKAKGRAEKLGLCIFFQTDPRGATVYVSKTPIDQANYNRLEAHCIY